MRARDLNFIFALRSADITTIKLVRLIAVLLVVFLISFQRISKLICSAHTQQTDQQFIIYQEKIGNDVRNEKKKTDCSPLKSEKFLFRWP